MAEKPRKRLVGHKDVREITYVYLNHTAPGAEESRRNSFVAQGFSLDENEGDEIDIGGSRDGGDVIRFAKGGSVTVRPNFLWREDHNVRKAIYEEVDPSVQRA